jgi:hypothetical protein
MQHLVDPSAETLPLAVRESQLRTRKVALDRAHAAADDIRRNPVFDQPLPQPCRRLDPIAADDAVDVCVRAREEIGGQPRAEETGGAADEHGAAVEEACARHPLAPPHIRRQHAVGQHLIERIERGKMTRRRPSASVDPVGELPDGG